MGLREASATSLTRIASRREQRRLPLRRPSVPSFKDDNVPLSDRAPWMVRGRMMLTTFGDRFLRGSFGHADRGHVIRSLTSQGSFRVAGDFSGARQERAARSRHRLGTFLEP